MAQTAKPSTRQPCWQWMMHTPGSQRHWHWLPGWSFASTVFAPLYQHLPGHHFGAHYPAVEHPSDLFCSIPADNSIWIGWSLGASLLQQFAPLWPPTTQQVLIGLASAYPATRLNRLSAFAEQLHTQQTEQHKHAILNRFCALCTLNSPHARSIRQHLRPHQTHDLDTLKRTFRWLQNAEKSNKEPKILHWHGLHDALMRPHDPTQNQSQPLGRSHAFMFEPDSQKNLLTGLSVWP